MENKLYNIGSEYNNRAQEQSSSSVPSSTLYGFGRIQPRPYLTATDYFMQTSGVCANVPFPNPAFASDHNYPNYADSKHFQVAGFRPLNVIEDINQMPFMYSDLQSTIAASNFPSSSPTMPHTNYNKKEIHINTRNNAQPASHQPTNNVYEFPMFSPFSSVVSNNGQKQDCLKQNSEILGEIRPFCKESQTCVSPALNSAGSDIRPKINNINRLTDKTFAEKKGSSKSQVLSKDDSPKSGQKETKQKYTPNKLKTTAKNISSKFNKNRSVNKIEHGTLSSSSYECEVCAKKFTFKRYLRCHMKIHSDIKPHHCSECGQNFLFLYSLKRHFTRAHSSDKLEFKCDNCGRCFNRMDNKKRHVKTCSKNTVEDATHGKVKSSKIKKSITRKNIRNYDANSLIEELKDKKDDDENGVYIDYEAVKDVVECDLLKQPQESKEKSKIKKEPDAFIKKTFKSVKITNKVLKAAAHKKSNRQCFKCHFCQKVFKFCSLLRLHFSEVHPDIQCKPFQCDHCSAAFAGLMSLKDHQKTHTGERPYHCLLCSATFRTAGNLRVHGRTHKSERPYQCQECSQWFKAKPVLTAHMKIHSNVRPHKCNKCDKAFLHKGKLLRHTHRVHGGFMPFRCTNCSSSFTSNIDLIQHVSTCDAKEVFSCHVCNRKFVGEDRLKKHLKTHAEVRPFKCELCGRGYLEERHLIVHFRKHSGEKPFNCEACKKSFSEACGLNKHVRKVHTQEFKCEKCKKCFGSGNELTIHERTHTGEKPFRCTECGQSFGNNNYLRIHNRKKHKK